MASSVTVLSLNIHGVEWWSTCVPHTHTSSFRSNYSSAATALNSGNLATLRSSVSFVTGSIISLQHEKTQAIKKQYGIRTWNTLTEYKT
jgi:hypothetical protein